MARATCAKPRLWCDTPQHVSDIWRCQLLDRREAEGREREAEAAAAREAALRAEVDAERAAAADAASARRAAEAELARLQVCYAAAQQFYSIQVAPSVVAMQVSCRLGCRTGSRS